VVALVADDDVMAAVEHAAEHYRERNAAFAEHARAVGLPCRAGDGLSLWLPLPAPARAVTEQLMRSGWLARPADDFLLAGAAALRGRRLGPVPTPAGTRPRCHGATDATRLACPSR